MSSCRPRLPIFLAIWTVRLQSALIVGLILLASSGCTSLREYIHNGLKVGPNYQEPTGPVSGEWIDSKTTGVNVATRDLTEWWSEFKDPKLNALIAEAQQQNLTLRSAGTRILAARAQRNIAAGNLFPQLQQAFAQHTRNQFSANTANPLPNRFFNDTGAGVNLSWEIDFWGRFTRGVEAADADLDASIANYDDAQVLLTAEVASTYVQIRVYQQRLRYVAENIKVQTKLSQAAETNFKAGKLKRIDDAQMRSNLTDTLALKEQLESGLRLSNNQMCILVGRPVLDLMPELGDGEIPSAPPEAAVGIPADLLRRRPDLRRAERLVAAQSARVGIATADLYPRIGIVGSLGYEATNFSNLFASKSFIGTIGPSLRWDVLNYGRLVNGIRVQDALFQTAAADYQNAVLRAGREVEDGIVLFLRSQARTNQLTISAEEARVAAEHAAELSKEKEFDINRLFVTTNFKVAQQDKLAQSRGDIALGLIQIYKALGGGWNMQSANCAPCAEPIPARAANQEPIRVQFLTPVAQESDSAVRTAPRER